MKWRSVLLVAGLLAAVSMPSDAPVRAQEAPDIPSAVALASSEFGVPLPLMECIRAREGGDNPQARGDGGRALGLWQFHAPTFRAAALAAGYPAWIANDPSWRADVIVSTRAAAALMARRDLGGPWHWTPYLDGRCR